jgi:hypothetical protein
LKRLHPKRSVLGTAALGTAFEDPRKQAARIDVEGAGDRDEFRNVHPAFEGLDPLDPVGRDPELSCELTLGEPRFSACTGNGRGDGSTSAGEFHAVRPGIAA